MKKEYNFGRGRRGAVLGAPPGKTRITIRIDDDIPSGSGPKCTEPAVAAIRSQ